MKKLPSFTLSELLVVLVISSLVISLSFLALNNVQKQVRNVTKTFDKQHRVAKLERLLRSDLNRYNGFYNATGSVLQLKNTTDSLSYHFTDSTVVRGKEVIPLQINQIMFFLDGVAVPSGAVDAIEGVFSDTFFQGGFFVYKRKDAAYYINP